MPVCAPSRRLTRRRWPIPAPGSWRSPAMPPSTWLARNRPKSLVLSAEPEIEENASTAERPATPEEAAIAAADAVMIEKALTALPQVYRETIVMREIQGLSYRDIASVTGIPLGTVMSRLARARSLLMAALAESKPMTDDAGEERFSGRKTILLQCRARRRARRRFQARLREANGDDPGFAAEYRRLAALRQAIRKLPKTQTSEDFRARITALAALAGAPQKPLSQPTDSWFGEWRSAALAASFALLLGSSLTFLALPAQGPDVMQELVAGHVRGHDFGPARRCRKFRPPHGQTLVRDADHGRRRKWSISAARGLNSWAAASKSSTTDPRRCSSSGI